MLQTSRIIARNGITRESRIRGTLVGAVIGDSLGSIHDTLPHSYAETASRADPLSLRAKLVRSGDQYIFRFSADSFTLFNATESLLMCPPSRLAEHFLTSLVQTYSTRGLNKSIPTSQVLSSLKQASSLKLSNNCVLPRAIACGLIDPALAPVLAGTTHAHVQAKESSLVLAKIIDRIWRAVKNEDVTQQLNDALKEHESLNKKYKILQDILKYNSEDEEETIYLQEEFRKRIGVSTAASVSLMAGLFGLMKAEQIQKKLNASDINATIAKMPAHIVALRGSERSKNILGNSNRLDAAKAFEREDAVLMDDKEFVMAVNWVLGLGGDVRTNGMVAGAIAGARWGVEGIPDEWKKYCEGVEKAEELAEMIIAKLK